VSIDNSKLFETLESPIITKTYSIEEQTLNRCISIGQNKYESSRNINVDSNASQMELDDLWWIDYLKGFEETTQSHKGFIRSVDLFCGPGGLSLGAKLAANALGYEFSSELAVDINKDGLGIHQANHTPRYSELESVANLVNYKINKDDFGARFEYEPTITSSKILKLRGSIDLITAGPPCQGHSTFNNHTRFNDPRNLLYLTVPAMAVALKVPAVVIENVPGVTASREGVVKTTIQLFLNSGYEVTFKVMNASSFGWPQNRKRFFLIATKGWEPLSLKTLESSFNRPPRPVSWALNNALSNEESSIMTEIPEYSKVNMDRINFLHDNDIDNLPNSERPDCHKGGNSYPSVYGRMRWDQPSPTLTTGFLSPGRGRYVHPNERRTIVLREAARIQGFPDNYIFSSTEKPIGRVAIAKAIGEAVPAPLGMIAVLSALANKK